GGRTSIRVGGGYAMNVITAVVAQSTVGVRDIRFALRTSVEAQLTAVSDDVVIDACKTGMLGSLETIQTVTEWIQAQQPKVLVVDPVMIATSGDRLLDRAAEEAMVAFCQHATVVTPNIDELARLTGQPRAYDEATAIGQASRWA